MGLFAAGALGFRLMEGLLVGSVIASTDAAAVFMVLRSRKIALGGHLSQLLELESGLNDPMAVFLTTTLVQLLTTPSTTFAQIVMSFLLSSLAGKPVAQLGLPQQTLIVMFNRAREYRVPSGSTTVEAGDVLFILGPRAVLEEVRHRFTAGLEPKGRNP